MRIRPAGADVSVNFGALLNSLVLSCPPSFNCWCGCKGVHLVTSADPCRADDSMCSSSYWTLLTTSVNWILFFVGSPITSVRARLLVPHL
jgi:hypothetical protein